MLQLLLRGGDAAGVLAADDVGHALGQGQVLALDQLAVADDVDGDAGIDVAQHIEVDVDDLADLDDVLLALLLALGVLDHGHGAVQLAQVQDVVDVHAAARSDVVEHDAVANLSDNHTATSRSFRISAMRMYLPLRACLK